MQLTRPLFALLCAMSASAAIAADAFETTLPNGLKIIVKEDRRAPTIAHMVWYRAGGMDEFNGTTGVAHVLEHMSSALGTLPTRSGPK